MIDEQAVSDELLSMAEAMDYLGISRRPCIACWSGAR